MITLHIENTVRDYPSWKATFDKFERFREGGGVRSLRVSRRVGEEDQVVIDLLFDSLDEATAFRAGLEKIWRTPQSQGELVGHATPVLYELVEERSVSAAAASAS